jgi:hypothetical protein
MYELLLCHRRGHWVGRSALRSHWRNHRRTVVKELQPALGFDGYSQLHRYSRLNLLYIAIRATRSWPIAALFSLLQRLPLPALGGGRAANDERWDLVESFRYASREKLLAALQSAEGAAALERLKADALGRVRRSTAIVTETLTVHDDPTLGHPRTVTRFCLRARRPSTRVQMLNRWGSSHKTLVEALRSQLHYREYDQLHVQSVPEERVKPAAIGAAGSEAFDGVAMLAYENQAVLIRRLFDPRTLIANFKLVKDEVHFADLQRSALVFGREEVSDLS